MIYNVDRAFLFLMGKCRVTIEHKKNKKYLTTKGNTNNTIFTTVDTIGHNSKIKNTIEKIPDGILRLYTETYF